MTDVGFDEQLSAWLSDGPTAAPGDLLATLEGAWATTPAGSARLRTGLARRWGVVRPRPMIHTSPAVLPLLLVLGVMLLISAALFAGRRGEPAPTPFVPPAVMASDVLGRWSTRAAAPGLLAGRWELTLGTFARIERGLQPAPGTFDPVGPTAAIWPPATATAARTELPEPGRNTDPPVNSVSIC